ncbi:MAG: YbhB/YbcL family Raf kinase inhibitor-like protein [Candidatus Scalindua sp.]
MLKYILKKSRVRNLIPLILFYCVIGIHVEVMGMEGNIMKLEIKSAAFGEGDLIPKQFTCDGADVSPPLSWSQSPEGTRSLVLICDDPDAPMGTWVHWVLYGLSPDTLEISENIPDDKELLGGAKHGINDFRKYGYGGPCPPGGTHRYFFRLYAVDTEVDLDPGATKGEVLEAIKGHVLAEGQLMGRYRR